MAYLTLNRVSKVFNRKTIVHDVNLSFEQGERVALLGPNGAGKSTLIRIIADLIKPGRGTVVRSWRENSNLGIMPQQDILPDDLRVGEILQLAALAKNIKLDRKQVDEFLGTSLSGKEKAFASSLSGGQKRQLSFLLSKLAEPSFLILDEPTTGMDLETIERMWESLMGLAVTTLVVTHDFNQIDQYFNRVIILDKGEIIADKRVTDIHKEGATIADFYQMKIGGEKGVSDSITVSAAKY